MRKLVIFIIIFLIINLVIVEEICYVNNWYMYMYVKLFKIDKWIY